MAPSFRAKLVAVAAGCLIVAAALTPVPSAAADPHALKINNCGCDPACYTGHVKDVRCDGSTLTFSSNGLPDLGDQLMTGITASNQQLPRPHYYTFTVPQHPQRAVRPTRTVPGAIAVAVNGIPIFDPSTQGPVDPITGKRPNAYEGGELDVCGGHAGRGDDYHYHIAPKCLIRDMGERRIEQIKQPIGFARDGFPILALGWFDKANDIEARLDRCRGATDASGAYFYNVKHTPNYDVLDCLTGRFDERRFAHDDWHARTDLYGGDIVGIPLAFAVDKYEWRAGNGATCEVMTGTLRHATVLNTDGSVSRLRNKRGALFYCNAHCYGQFMEADPVSGVGGRIIYFESPRTACPAALDLAHLTTFAAYEGPPQSRKGPPSTGAHALRPGPGPGPGPGRGPGPRRPPGPPPPRNLYQ